MSAVLNSAAELTFSEFLGTGRLAGECFTKQTDFDWTSRQQRQPSVRLLHIIHQQQALNINRTYSDITLATLNDRFSEHLYSPRMADTMRQTQQNIIYDDKV